MLVSYNWLKELIDFDFSITELADILTMLGLEIDAIENYGEKYKGFFTAKVIEKEKHPNADKLSVCKVRINEELRTVVCGAQNVEAGQKVILGLPGAIVPVNGLKLETKAVRNVVSEGMICSEFELGVSDEKSGIWVLPESVNEGISLADYLGMNDIIFEIGITPNRSDCLSHIGIAREISAYLSYNSGKDSKIKYPEININESVSKSQDPVRIEVIDITNCPRYTARVIRNVRIGESPAWLKNRLTMLGQRSINNVVDITNYVLLECGHPLHAFDLDLLKGNKIIVKTAAVGEKFTTLDKAERQLDGEILMICDGERSVAIGGVMGGLNSEINENTKNVLLESAYFNPSSIRRTSKKLAIQSESSYRFERGVDIDNIIYASNRATQLISEICGGQPEGEVIDIYPVKKAKPIINLRYQRARDIIGLDLSSQTIISIIKSLGFEIISEEENQITVEIPNYRVDISLEIDLIEEIARLYNYDNLTPDFTSNIDFSGKGVPEKLQVNPYRDRIKNFLTYSGFNEMVTQNIVDPESAEITGETPFKISNPLGEQLSMMRTSLIPSFLKTIGRNNALGTYNIRFFEIGKSFHRTDNMNEFIQNVAEIEELLIAMSGEVTPTRWDEKPRLIDFFDIKGLFTDLKNFFGLNQLELTTRQEKSKLFNANHLEIIMNGKGIGEIGEISKAIQLKYDIRYPVFLLRFNLTELRKAEVTENKYQKVSPYPPVLRDLAFIVEENLPAIKLYDEIVKTGGILLKSVEIFDLYKGHNIAEGMKSIAFSMVFNSEDHTLEENEVTAVIEDIIGKVEKKFGAKLRSF